MAVRRLLRYLHQKCPTWREPNDIRCSETVIPTVNDVSLIAHNNYPLSLPLSYGVRKLVNWISLKQSLATCDSIGVTSLTILFCNRSGHPTMTIALLSTLDKPKCL